ncbi:MAG: BadF/BadG/BcrA/BcrD ATPase family protein [Owenweeksia sp.]
MIYLAESGSTKTDAVILNPDGSEVCRVNTMGFNPYFHTSESIGKEMAKVNTIRKYGTDITQVYFYGSGCSSDKLCTVVSKGLAMVFPNAKIVVDHDLKACAFATYTGQPAISCILGTGSNSVYFDGKDIETLDSGLGFILGDEGSASHIGKKLITSYFYRTMPDKLRVKFKEQYNLDKDYVVKKVYQNDHANVFLAGFAPFANSHIDNPFCWEAVFSSFRDFVEFHVLGFPQAREVPVHFVGSVGYHFKDILNDVLLYFDLNAGNIIQKPLEGLIRYHKEHVFPSGKIVKSS